MTPPAVAAGRFGAAVVLGLALGVVYSFLRPVKRRHLGDLVFSACALWGWIWLTFGICRGDVRGAYLAGMAAGAWATHGAFAPVFRVFWKIIGIPAKKFRILQKNCLHLVKTGLQ